ncbi:MAG: 30S ribosome-binding factor RbfA [Chromatiales bacterium]|jgi:ribosome-binding factor A
MTRDFQRTDRVGAQLQRELSSLIHDEVDEPGLGMVTVQEVRVVRDLSHAKVFFTVMDNVLSREECAKRLNQAAGHLRWLLGQELKLRTVPKLQFVYDESVEQGERLASLIEQAVATDDPDEAD